MHPGMHTLLMEPEYNAYGAERGDFEMFIAYDGCAAISRARDLQFELARRCRGEVKIHASSWNFSLLAHPRLREQAAAESTNADMAVIAVRGNDDLPAYLQVWLKHWISAKAGTSAALVALLDPRASSDGEQNIIGRCLRRMAESAGIDFFCNLDSARIPTPELVC
jgi:hypothetical protein